MIKRVMVVACAVAACLVSQQARAASISIETQVSPPMLGEHGFVFLNFSGFGDPGFPNLGAFDINLSFDSSILEPNRVTFFGALGDPDTRTFVYNAGSYTPATPGAGEAITGAFAGMGETQVFDVSLLEDSLATCIFCTGPYLEDLQSSPFFGVGFIFNTLAVGTSPLAVQINGLSDGNGNALMATTSGGSLTVVPVPEPSTMLLVLGAMPWVVSRARRRWREIGS